MSGELIDRTGDRYEKHQMLMAAGMPWLYEEIKDPDRIPKGDMPGDKVNIGPEHIKKAQLIVPKLLEQLIPTLEEHPYHRAVLAVCGGSGVGKSEIASLLSYYLNKNGIGSYTVSGDNYPHRIPRYNDAERLRIFRKSGVKGLISHGQYCADRQRILKELQINDIDFDPALLNSYPWLSYYQRAGRNGLKNYLGTENEIDFKELNEIITQFKNGINSIFLKRMGRGESELWYEAVDFHDSKVMIIEWTHGNSHNLQGVDIPVLLNSTPQETLEHRKTRNRDGGTDSPFTTMVLGIEQELLISQADRARIIVSKAGDILSYEEYQKIMFQG